MTRLIEIDPSVEQIPEEDGHEFGYYAFDTLPPMDIQVIDNNENPDDEEVNQNLPIDINK